MNMNQGYLKKLLKLGAIQWEFKTFSNTNTKWSVDLMDRKVEGTYLSKQDSKCGRTFDQRRLCS